MKNTELASGIGRSLTQTKEYLSYLEKQGYVKVSTNKKKLGGWSNRRCISLGAK